MPVLRIKNGAVWEPIPPGHTVHDEGIVVPFEPIINFVGDTVTVTDDPTGTQTNVAVLPEVEVGTIQPTIPAVDIWYYTGVMARGALPSSLSLTDPPTTVGVYGYNLTADAVVHLGGTAIPTTFVSDKQLTATIDPAGQTAGTVDLTVVSPAGTSPAVTFTFIVPPPPSITSITPTGTHIGWNPARIQITGAYFDSTSVVMVNGVAQPTEFISSTEIVGLCDLTATTAGTVSITVQNGGTP